MKNISKESVNRLSKTISQDRGRTNILRKYEQRLIAFLVQCIPSWMTSNMLTAIGFSGSILIFVAFLLATYIHPAMLLLGVLGYIINWFGDSLDGRVAYYRKTPRKWYGFSLDLIIDWIGILLMGWGFIVYVDGVWEMMGFGFVVLYGWEIVTTLVRYKITDKYSIDSGLLGPTEVRVVISSIFILEVLVHNSILYSSTLACAILFITNIVDTKNLLKAGDERDRTEREKKADE